MRIPFKTDSIDGLENVMSLKGIRPLSIRIHQQSGNIVLECPDAPKIPKDSLKEALGKLPWKEIKERVEEKGGEYTNKKKGIEYLMT